MFPARAMIRTIAPATPCRSPQRAVNQTVAGGEVKALDPADYFPVTINKSITVTGVQGAGIDTNGGTAVSVTAFSITVHLDHLIINNVSGSGGTAISGTGISLEVTHCTIQGYGTGLVVTESGFVIADTIIKDNGMGIQMLRVSGTLDRVQLFSNTTGVFMPNLATLFVGGSAIERNGTGISIEAVSTVTSFGDNHIKGNGTDVKGGTLTNVGTQ
jgi:hypothetical protein